ncbi:hypothetical protein [Microbacterium aureliae]
MADDRYRRYRARHRDRVREDERRRTARRSARTPEQIAADRARLRPDGLRYCPACRRKLRFAEFDANRSRPDGLATHCRTCALVAHAARTGRRLTPA